MEDEVIGKRNSIVEGVEPEAETGITKKNVSSPRNIVLRMMTSSGIVRITVPGTGRGKRIEGILLYIPPKYYTLRQNFRDAQLHHFLGKVSLVVVRRNFTEIFQDVWSDKSEDHTNTYDSEN